MGKVIAAEHRAISKAVRFSAEQVQWCLREIGSQRGLVDSLISQVRGFIPRVQGAWIGGDADAFAADINRRLVPALLEWVTGMDAVKAGLQQAAQVVDQADSAVRAQADALGDLFAQI